MSFPNAYTSRTRSCMDATQLRVLPYVSALHRHTISRRTRGRRMSHVGSDTMAYVRGLSLQQGTCYAHTSGLQSNIRGPLRVPCTCSYACTEGLSPTTLGRERRKRGGLSLASQAHHMTHPRLGGSYMPRGLDLPWQTNHALCE